MTDTITLPRRHIDYAADALEHLIKNYNGSESFEVLVSEIIHHLRKALAAEQPKPEPVAVFDEQMGHPVLLLGSPMLKDKQPLYTAPPALAAEQPKPSEDVEALRMSTQIRDCK